MTKDKIIDIDEVLAQLTMSEKVKLTSGQDAWSTVPIRRLGIPSVRVSDGPSGVRGTKFFNSVPTACLPSGAALAGCWNKELMYKVGKLNGQQARAKGVAILLGPNINCFRSPVCGRSFETFGEDPFLSGHMSAQYCKGLHSEKIGFCPKHLVCNDKEEYRMTLNVVVSERALREIYLMPFMITQKEADPILYMTSYSKLNGTFCSENSHLMKDIVRNEWGFKGAFVSDWYGTVSNADSLNAGLSLEMPGPSIWRDKLTHYSLFHNTVTEETLDELVRQVLKVVQVAQKSGIPEHALEGMKDDEETTLLLKQSALEAIVLLKNEKILPLKKDKKVLLVGEAAIIPTYSSGGCAHVVPYRAISPYQGFVSKVGRELVEYEMGAPNRKTFPSFAVFAEDSSNPRPISYAVYDDPRTVKNREPVNQEWISHVDAILGDFDPKRLRNPEQLYALFKVKLRVPESGKYCIHLKVSGMARIFIDDKFVAVNDQIHKVSGAFGSDAPEIYVDVELSSEVTHTLEIDFESTIGISSFITSYGYVLSGITKSLDVKRLVKQAAEHAALYDQVVVITGLNKDFEVEGLDRENMEFPAYQNALVEAILEKNKNTVVVIESGTPLTIPWADKAGAIIRSSYLGNELGNALADVIYGDYNPSGKLTFTWPKRYEDHPTFLFNKVDANYNLRYGEDIFAGYRYFDSKSIDPLFPFGYGLSYTNFEISDLCISVMDKTDGFINFSVQIFNSGTMKGAEVIQGYVSFKSNTIQRAAKELKAFEKVELEAGETKIVNFSMDVKYACSFYNEMNNKWTIEKGSYKLLVGTSSRDPNFLEGFFEIKSTKHWTGL